MEKIDDNLQPQTTYPGAIRTVIYLPLISYIIWGYFMYVYT